MILAVALLLMAPFIAYGLMLLGERVSEYVGERRRGER